MSSARPKINTEGVADDVIDADYSEVVDEVDKVVDKVADDEAEYEQK